MEELCSMYIIIFTMGTTVVFFIFLSSPKKIFSAKFIMFLAGPSKVPLVGPIPSSQISSAALASSNVIGINSGINPSGLNPIDSFGPSSVYGNGIGNYATNVKPVVENFGPQTFETGSSSFNSNKYGSSSSFGATVGQYGNTSPFYKKELNLSPQYNNLNSLQSQYTQGSYADKYQGFQSGQVNYDCVCVPFDQCPAQHVIGRKDDLYLPIDPRNLKTDILAEDNSNSTSPESNKNSTKVEETKKISKRDVESAQERNSTEKANVEPVSTKMFQFF